jgi:imidazolonepropionase-like amidohydrolase
VTIVKTFMLLAKKVQDKGIKIRNGTDCPNGGKAALSEQVLLAQYGFSISSIIQISTINGATALDGKVYNYSTTK